MSRMSRLLLIAISVAAGLLLVSRCAAIADCENAGGQPAVRNDDSVECITL